MERRFIVVMDSQGAEEPYAVIDTHATTIDARYVDLAETEEEAQAYADEAEYDALYAAGLIEER